MAAEPRQVSGWAMAALACAVASACPPAAVVGTLLAAMALRDVHRHPQRGGRRLALVAMAISLAATAGWGACAAWWQVRVRAPMLQGPAPALEAGLAGDHRTFRAAFLGGDPADASVFLAMVAGRYGALRGAAQRHDPTAAARNQDFRRVWIPYALQFESGQVDADAVFVIVEPGRGFVLKFAWLALRDPSEGDLVYPPGGRAEAEAPPPPSPAGPVRQEPPSGP